MKRIKKRRLELEEGKEEKRNQEMDRTGRGFRRGKGEERKEIESGEGNGGKNREEKRESERRKRRKKRNEIENKRHKRMKKRKEGEKKRQVERTKKWKKNKENKEYSHKENRNKIMGVGRNLTRTKGTINKIFSEKGRKLKQLEIQSAKFSYFYEIYSERNSDSLDIR